MSQMGQEREPNGPRGTEGVGKLGRREVKGQRVRMRGAALGARAAGVGDEGDWVDGLFVSLADRTSIKCM